MTGDSWFNSQQEQENFPWNIQSEFQKIRSPLCNEYGGMGGEFSILLRKQWKCNICGHFHVIKAHGRHVS